ncbi:hypothetical protein BDB01DRAFT_799641 [Pilobolus umbonatus]|nr:hypothetical protein BDB01DRAFT_799641 [Pilobolus umbonatus]
MNNLYEYDSIDAILRESTCQKDLQSCGSSVLQLYENILTVLKQTKDEEDDILQNLLQKTASLIDYGQEAILGYSYDKVPDYWRRMLIDAGLLKTMIQLRLLIAVSGDALEKHVQTLIWDLDICAIVSGCPGTNRRSISNTVLEKAQDLLFHHRKDKEPSKKKICTEKQTPRKTIPPQLNYPVNRLMEPPSFEWFLNHCNQLIPTPFIIPKGSIDYWPAFTDHPWKSMDYLFSVAGDRVVPVEIGSQYTDSNWGQKMMRFSDFVNDYIVSDVRIPAYLAQHDLLYQIPRLERDIVVPDYCYIEPNITEHYKSRPTDVIKNAWFGPRNTISPLHHDPYHNLLVQVVGSKYIRLYSPDQTHLLYPRKGLMTNTSQVDIDNYDTIEYPLFDKAEYVECILEEGEMLYIPPKWWHYVKSLETSFSVSLWF